MKHNLVLKRIWLLPILIVVLVATHGTAVYEVLSRKTWMIGLGLIVLVLLIHIGGFGFVYRTFRRRFRRKS